MATLFLACLVCGALFTLASVVLGFVGHGLGPAHGHGHFELGHSHAESGHGHPGSHGGHGSADGGSASDHSGALPLLNASSVIGSLTWFGAAGFLLLRLGDWALPA